VVCRALDWELSTADVLRLIRADPHPVALVGTWAGGSDIVASDPVRVCCAPEPAGVVLDTPLPGPAGASTRTGAGFGGGWIGYLGFGMAGQVLPVPPAPGQPRRLPAWWFGYYDHVAGGRSRHYGHPAVVTRLSAVSMSCRGVQTPSARRRGVIPVAASG
jgi:hypothetical protein